MGSHPSKQKKSKQIKPESETQQQQEVALILSIKSNATNQQQSFATTTISATSKIQPKSTIEPGG